MVPPEYSVFFATLAAVEATLFGLIFVVISIVSEDSTTAGPPLERQIKVVTAYTALLNPLIISLFALVPHQQVGIIVLVMAFIGLLNTAIQAFTVIKHFSQWNASIRHSLFLVAGFVLYGYEIYSGFRLVQIPTDVITLYVLSDILVFISFFGIIRAWELVGVRFVQFRGGRSTSPTPEKEGLTNPSSTPAIDDRKKDSA